MKIMKSLFCKHKWIITDPAYGDMKSVFVGYCKYEKCSKEKLK